MVYFFIQKYFNPMCVTYFQKSKTIFFGKFLSSILLIADFTFHIQIVNLKVLGRRMFIKKTSKSLRRLIEVNFHCLFIRIQSFLAVFQVKTQPGVRF